jgi:hypothetical protein
MSHAVEAFPMDSGGQGADVFPIRDRLRLRDSFGHVVLELRTRSQAFRCLARGPWALFMAIAVHWQTHAEAWPSQAALARFTGFSVRAVRDFADVLVRDGFLRVRRERRASGAERIYYAPGFVLLRELGVLAERLPRGLSKTAADDGGDTEFVRAAPAAPAAGPPAEPTAAPPAAIAEEPRDQDPRTFCSSRETHKHASVPLARPPAASETASRRHERQEASPPSAALGRELAREIRATDVNADSPKITDEDRAIARAALEDRWRRRFPGRDVPRWFDRHDVELIARCSTILDGDIDSKIDAHRAALDGAFAASRNGPPTVRFIWGSLEHFLGHVERGSRRKVARPTRAGAPLGHAQGATPPTPLTPEERARQVADVARFLSAGAMFEGRRHRDVGVHASTGTS